MKAIIKGFIFLVCLFLLVGCLSKPSDIDNGQGDGTAGVSKEKEAPMFPHPQDWATPASHGGWVLQNASPDPCLGCHKRVSGKVETIPTCASCHPIYPHQGDFGKGEVHGQAFIDKGRDACATKCHGSDLEGGLSGLSCNSCHEAYPHAEGWEKGGGHGVFFSNKYESISKTACFRCHGKPIAFTETQTRGFLKEKSMCYGCHWAYPHIGYDTDTYKYGWVWNQEKDPPDPPEFGHLPYLIHSDSLLDIESGLDDYHPTDDDDLRLLPALQDTCGGSTANNCHMGGYRSKKASHTSNVCGQYCHKQTP